MAKAFPNSASFSSPHDGLAVDARRRVLQALERIGWRVKRQRGSHRMLQRTGWEDVVFAFHDGEEIGPKMLARIGRRTGLEPGDL